MSTHHHLWALLNSSSDVDDDNFDNNSKDNDKSPTKTHLLPPPPPPEMAGKKREVAEGNFGGAPESSEHEIHIWTERERRKKMRNMFSNLHALLPHLPAKADKSTIVDEAVNYIKSLQQTLQKLQNQKLEKLPNNNTNTNTNTNIINNNNPVVSFNNNVVNYHPQQQQSSATTTREAFLADQVYSTATATATAAATTNVIPPLPLPFYGTTTAFQTWTSSNLVLSICGGDAHFCVCSGKKPGLFAAVCYVLDKHQIEVVSAHVSSDFHRTFFMIQAHANGGCDEFGATMVAEEIFKQAAGEIIFWLNS